MDIVEALLPKDLPVLRRLMAEYLLEFDPASDPRATWDDEYYEACRLGLASGTHGILLAQAGGEVAGFAIVRLERQWYRASLLLGHIEELYVRADSRRHGLGEALARAGEAWLSARGAATVAAMVIEDNAAVLPFWQGRGYVSRAWQLFHT
jgi:ribosomal protein S18 acetylase RimI-like enzyme